MRDKRTPKDVCGEAREGLMKDMNICQKKLFSREPQSGYGVGSIELAKCAIFNTNCTISCDTRTHFL